MLSDRDRIFSNLHGQDEWRLAGAKRRGGHGMLLGARG